MNRTKLKKRAAFRLRDKHLWAHQFRRRGLASMRVEWDRIQKMVEQLPIDDLPEFAQNWIYMLLRIRTVDVAHFLRRGDFPFFDAWAHRFHILDETLEKLGYALPARTPFIYAGYIAAGLSATAETVFHDTGGPKNIGSAFANPDKAPKKPA